MQQALAENCPSLLGTVDLTSLEVQEACLMCVSCVSPSNCVCVYYNMYIYISCAFTFSIKASEKYRVMGHDEWHCPSRYGAFGHSSES